MRALVRAPLLLRRLYPGALWRHQAAGRKIWLTFDDGPVPGVTGEVLDLLSSFRIPATFFCVGQNVELNPDLYARILTEGHTTGNHTYHHTDGWVTSFRSYLREVEMCAGLVHSNLFRPPYGRMRRSQFTALRKKYRIVMWDVLPCDYDRSLSAGEVLSLALRYARPGSIVVFHDSEKAKANMLGALPHFIEDMLRQGYTFEKL
jgi:peptidoglycan-N-acetylglucosamine deacetylase